MRYGLKIIFFFKFLKVKKHWKSFFINDDSPNIKYTDQMIYTCNLIQSVWLEREKTIFIYDNY